MSRWLSIVGIGEDGLAGLSPAARTLVETAETLVGGERHLALAPSGTAERIVWAKPLSDTLRIIAERRGRRVTVLASGDPLWYGVGVLLARHFPRDEMTVLPQPSAFSLAVARLGWALADCACLSLHSRPLDSLRLHLAPGRRLLLLSEDGATPRRVARLLAETGWGRSRLTVFEHLGGDREASQGDLAEAWGERLTTDLNTIALECETGPDARPLSRLAGLPDDAFEHDGQLTKREVRAATLASLAPLPGELLWDIGAGCGSIGIEWLRATENCTAVAVERDPARAAVIARNAAALGVPGLEIILGEAPETLPEQSPPDAIFVGGGIGDPGLLPALWARLRPDGRLVANAVSIEGERTLLDWQARHGGSLSRIAVSRAEPLGRHQAWRPMLPVIQLAVTKSG
ncbi:MAG TPA: precorrin-6y C5,15-methyltransferase (decarboxylating) subunit CbiE [Stellaceae bacterium]|jgi:precorrin-6Y C5,15-methyltransferase (decarboxylating)|nr:precorrin-6y C5,15-methyltransferase (decarboxylating) subunit CbiE [Stellaceae bacterium]